MELFQSTTTTTRRRTDRDSSVETIPVEHQDHPTEQTLLETDTESPSEPLNDSPSETLIDAPNESLSDYLMNHQKRTFLALYFQNLGKVKKKINQTTNHDHLLKIPKELETKRLGF